MLDYRSNPAAEITLELFSNGKIMTYSGKAVFTEIKIRPASSRDRRHG